MNHTFAQAASAGCTPGHILSGERLQVFAGGGQP